MVGVPFDGAVLGRKGAAEGPAAIRKALSGFSNFNPELGVGLEGARVFDLGNLDVESQDVRKAHAQIQAEVAGDLLEGSLLVILGGDNSVSLPALRAFAGVFERIGLIVIDSHLDLRGELDGRPTSGSSYGLAIEGVRGLDARRVVEIGTHGFLNSRKYFEKAKRLGVDVVTAEEVKRRGPAAVAREAYARASKGAEAVYLSIDLDAVGLAEVPGVSAPSAGGMSAADLFELVYLIGKGAKVSCADLVELAPSLDQSGRSQRVAAAALTYIIAAFQSKAKGKR